MGGWCWRGVESLNWDRLKSCAYHVYTSTHTHTHTYTHTHTHTHTQHVHYTQYMTCCVYAGREDITLGNILEFISGASKLPATGFPKNPAIFFCNEDRLPRASTCDISITFSRKLGILQYEEFKEKMDFCILGSYGFGSV